MIKLLINAIYTVYAGLACLGMYLLHMFLTLILGTIIFNYLRAYYLTARWTGKILFFMLGIKLTTHGGENLKLDKPVIFFINHQSLLDILLLFIYMPVGTAFLMKKELIYIPVIGWWMALWGHVTIEREKSKKAYLTFDTIMERLITGRSIIIFPEGTRSRDGKLQKFKRGGAMLAVRTGASVVPMVIDGTYNFKPKGRMWISPTNVTVTIFPAIPVKALATDDPGFKQATRELGDQAYKIVAGCLAK